MDHWHKFARVRGIWAILVALLCFSAAWAEDSYPEYITELKVIGGTSGETEALITTLKDQGWTHLSKDLNDNAGGDYIYLLYKKGSRNNPNGGYITDIKICTSNEDACTIDGRTYYRIPFAGGYDFRTSKGNLNSKTKSGMKMWIYSTTDNFSDKRAVSGIYFNSSSSGAVSGMDLNAGAGGDYIYMHISTLTKQNRPSSDPVIPSSLEYNGKDQKLVSTNADLWNGTMYYRWSPDGSNITSINDIKARTAGSYTVYYFAGPTDYASSSTLHSQKVTISKSPNKGVSVNIGASYPYGTSFSPSLSGTNLSTGSITYQYATSRDGTYSSTKPTSVGTHWVQAVIAGDDNCYKKITSAKSFKILPLIQNMTIAAIPAQTYTGSAICPTISIKDGSKTLYNGSDYTVSCYNNVSASSNAYAYISGIGNYAGSLNKYFEISPKSVQGFELTSTWEKEGSEYIPIIVVKDGEKTLQENIDYTVDVSVIEGYVNVVINGLGNYTKSVQSNISEVHTVNVPEGLAISDAYTTIGMVKYYKPGETYTLTLTSTKVNEVIGEIAGVEANFASDRKSATFMMPSNDVEISATTTEVHTVNVPEGLAISDAYTTIGTVKYYKPGETYTLTVSNANDIIDEITGVEAEIFQDRKSARFTMPSNDVEISATITEVHSVSVPKDLTISDAYVSFDELIFNNDLLFINKINYYKPGETYTLTLTHSPFSFIFIKENLVIDEISGVEAVLASDRKSATFTMPNKDVEISASIIDVYTVNVPEGVTISDAYVTISETNYYKPGETYTLTVSNTNDIIDEITGVEAEILNDRKSARFTMPSNDVEISATISEVHTVSVPEGFTISDAYTTIGGVNYYKSGEIYTLTATKENEVIDEITGVTTTIAADKRTATFTMPRENVIISTTLFKIWGDGDGSEENPYTISRTLELDSLSKRVNAGNSYEGKYFKLTKDIEFSHEGKWEGSLTNTDDLIENYTAIGTVKHGFMGIFDGNGKNIRGIRINKTSDSHQGLFGYLGGGAVVENVRLADVVILGYYYTGGIAGENKGEIRKCTVDSVLIKSIDKAFYHGGVVGYNSGTVSGNTSSATLTSTDGEDFGGIVGSSYEGTVKENLAIGASISADSRYGAVVGFLSSEVSLINNYYYSCTVGDKVNATNVGVNSHDITENNGAVAISFTAPAAVENLAYNKLSQNLVTAGVVNYGTLLYSLDGESYGIEIPTAVDVKNYTVYYKVDSDKGILFDVQQIDVSIAPKSVQSIELVYDEHPIYTGSAICPDVVVKDGEKTLVQGTDYTFECTNNVNVGDKATIGVFGIGNYTGSQYGPIMIAPKSVQGFELAYDEHPVYTGSAICPDVVVKDGEKTLVLGTDYTFECTNNVNVGDKATIGVFGIGNYTGSQYGPITITLKSIASESVVATATWKKDGSEYIPTVVVKDGKKILQENTDYTVEVSVIDGYVNAVINGFGNYTGTTYVKSKYMVDVEVVYFDENGKEQTKTFSGVALDGSETRLEAGVYIVDKDLVFDHTLYLDGDVSLVLTDGATMSVGTVDNPIIYCIRGNNYSLNIYGQHLQSGKLSLYSMSAPGIMVLNLTIDGGNIDVTSDHIGISVSENTRINGGSIIVKSKYNAFELLGNLTIKGGFVEASSDVTSGIHVANRLVINSGSVVLTGWRGLSTNGDFEINGGSVTARGSSTYGIMVLKNLFINGGQIESSGFNGAVTIAEGLYYTDGKGASFKGTLTSAEKKALAGKKIRSYVPAITFTDETVGKRVTINADYTEKVPLSVPDAVAVDFVEIKRNLLPLTPATIVLPVQLPEGTTFNARFYYLKEVKQVGCSWNAVMKYIGSNNLPEPNTPYAVILNDGEDKLEFDLHGEQATVRTAKIADNWDLSNKWQFVGTYSYKVWEEGNDEIGLVYGFAGSNEDGIARGEFGRVMAGAYAVPMRSYLKKRDKDVRVTGCAQGIRANGAAYSAVFSNTDIIGVEFIDEEEQTTAIGRMNTRTGEFKIDRWYDLKGRKVDNVNRDTKGAYYGKKVFKK
jgi:hypothetical protein